MEAQRSADGLAKRVRLRVLAANTAGAVIVFTYFSFLTPGGAEWSAEDSQSLLVFVVFMAVVTMVGLVQGRRRFRPVARWMSGDRAPHPSERELILRLPWLEARASFEFWVAAAALFPGLNIIYGTTRQGVIRLLVGILLGGLCASLITYLSVERYLRPLFARALAGEAPTRSTTLGLRTRLLLGWGLASGLPLLAIAVVPLGNPGVGASELVPPMVFLALVGFVAGGVVIAGLAKSVAEPLSTLQTAVNFVRRGDLDVSIAVDDGGEVGMLQAGFNRMVAGLRDRQHLRDLFGRHVGDEVAMQALERGVGLGGETRDVTALFVDLTGSTMLAQERPATEVVALLNDFFGAVVDLVGREGGWVNKFEGDGALCVFGAPVPQDDHAARGLRAARALHARLVEVARTRPGLDAGIGVSSGPAVAGNVGAESRYEYTVIGDPVNEAARLTEAAKQRPSRVLAGEGAVKAAGDEGRNWQPVGDLPLRGRAQPTRAYEPLLPG